MSNSKAKAKGILNAIGGISNWVTHEPEKGNRNTEG
jgi:hypothetical protein